MNFNEVNFEFAAGTVKQLPQSDIPEIVFSGHSNVGKSSLINKLVQRKSLARMSAQPGKTATINFYRLRNCRFVDLPGYGYAKVSQAERERWGKLMEDFFAASLFQLGVMIVDARHKPTADDVTMAEWFKGAPCRLVVVANKLDKLKKSEIEPNLALIRETLGLPAEVPVIPFSAEKGQGRNELLAEINKLV